MKANFLSHLTLVSVAVHVGLIGVVTIEQTSPNVTDDKLDFSILVVPPSAIIRLSFTLTN